ncbi:flavodoxin-dependent (E)-4-hydroxy-3-methylbut-2-enyl-diphosphate synthase [Candidatus Magnetominusculus xianensis]|uniref:4-hydroxy-3-methylbut-2-en-1-yl diphosphate synthase (flavodoxin) n=1 Tax=Candidatus Magnetominusculus xianensis TaxID=1748249 RepID=A0ABR5SDA4_9BACT|nr:flavodoxin-dependent (E)-4-hydroxy-3-methylbut-2-enyl-diphosphate synthase [Candidatus Magnetominusculus xianensis]KWT76822.1 4-hydroxy-3-methylbut-2-en-1-yl diphosphate synthase [Candidatus Magnetominusculus xianensis]MBF0402672.1 flavodoxin-dependent (E)-4-hydroxy-3-methylbut-2-enyl-diphosphate synthase [Nitrospirota bacterium]
MSQTRTRKIYVGTVAVGGDAPISVQSMTKTPTTDVQATVNQIAALKEAGCDIIRIAVLNDDAAEALSKIKRSVSIPIIADIHFDWKLALKSIAGGVDGLRINPGNIGALWKVKELVNACKDKGIPIRIGVNAGSLQKDILMSYGHPTPEAIVESARRHIEILEEMDFNLIKVSLKASNVPSTVEAYRAFSRQYDYPLHIGVSEAGPPPSGIIKSAVGLGILLYEGIGDTMRVSLTAQPEEEVKTAYSILRSIGLRAHGIDIISCPTCGRTRIDLINLVKEAEERLRPLKKTITVAIMGCEVNGPGEAKEADVGIAGGNGVGLLFKKGVVVKKVMESELLDCLVETISTL